MDVFRQLQVLCVAIIVAHIGAEFNLTVITPMDTLFINGIDVEVDFECGSRVIFVCEIKPYRTQAAWEVNSTTYALCLFQSCVTYPPFPAYHNFSMSLATETFNLTTDPITLAARRSIYSCNDGVTALSVDAIVKVYVKNTTLEMDTSTANQITLTTGCVYPYGKDDMAFEWFISKDRMLLEKSRFVPDEMQSIESFACTENSDCAGAESVQFNSTVTVVVDNLDNGDDYHICAVVKHIEEPDRHNAVHCSVTTYKIRNDTANRSPTKTFASWKIHLGFSFILSISRWILILQCLYHLIIIKEKSCARLFVICLVGLLLPGLGLFLLRCKKGGIYCQSKSIITVILSILSSLAMDIPLTCVFLVYGLTQWCFYLLVAFVYTLLAWIMSAVILATIHDRPRCRHCKHLSDFICKLCNMNYCKECVRDSTDQQMMCARPGCTHCQRLSDYKCKLCNKNYCKKCVKHDECETDQQMICGLCSKAQNEMKTYCSECKKFLCNSCSINHTMCTGILLKHPQHGVKEKEIICETPGHSSSVSYCLKCKRYLCKDCLELSHQKHCLLWIKGDFDLKMFGMFSQERDRLCCTSVTTDNLGYCLSCELYICEVCSVSHRQDKHHFIMHYPKGSRIDSNEQQYCERHTETLAECYSYTEHAYLCADCFEHGEQLKFRKPTPNKMISKNTRCVLHKFIANETCHTDSYCLICDKCLCRRCFLLHRRFKEHYIKTHERNSYLCKRCQKRGNFFPVECVQLDSFALACAECFEKAEDILRQPHDDELVKALKSTFSKGIPCQIHTFPFSDTESSVQSKVYCLVCKAYMCEKCFEKHSFLKRIWRKDYKLEKWSQSRCSDFENTAPELGCKAIVCLSLLGICYECCCKRDSKKIG